MIENNYSSEEVQEQDFDLAAVCLRYFAYWRWFVGSVILCLACAWGYSRFQTPMYEVSATLLIREGSQKGSSSADGMLAAMQDFGMMSMTSNFDNEIERLKTRTLVQQTITDLGLYISTVKPFTFGFDHPMYENIPLHVYMSPQEAQKLDHPVTLKLELDSMGVLQVEAEFEQDEEVQHVSQRFEQLPAVLPTAVGAISFSRNELVACDAYPCHLKTFIDNPKSVAADYAANLTVERLSKSTTIASIHLKSAVRKRGEDFITGLVANYNRNANDEKNEIAERTAEFIQDRVGIINHDLGRTESRMADFKQKSGLTNLAADAQLTLMENSKYEQKRTEIAIQISLVKFLSNYINDPKNQKEVIPANVGLTDQGLASLINQYNALIIEQKRLLRTSFEDNPAVIQMNTRVEAMRQNVRTSVTSVLKGLDISLADMERQTSKYGNRINNAPKQEQEFVTIARQQEIQSALYTMLLQKRELNSITLAATANNSRFIEDPLASFQPILPQKKLFLLIGLFVGLGLPVLFIYVSDLLRYKIQTKDDLEKITDVPVIGELPQTTTAPVVGAIYLHENENGLMEEAFRALRTNLMFMLRPEDKVIMVSSTQPGEGKSFVAANLALSLSFLQKKVIVVGLDIRKPGLNRVFDLSTHKRGLSEYLANPGQTLLTELIQPSKLSSYLDILIGGTIPPNPTELVSRDSLEQAIAQLKERYDYIIIDTAPIAMVTDTMILSRVADTCLYVCRADVTPKAAFAFVNYLKEEKKTPSLSVVLNGIDFNSRTYRRYRRRYGYGRGYGYGYGDS